jgi:hypothetical protein
MRKKAVVLAVFCLLVFAGGAHAVTLQQGWYAKVDLVQVYGYGPMGTQLLEDVSFTTPLGQCGPFQVTDGGISGGFARYVLVPSTMTGAGPGDSFTLPISMPFGTGTPIAYFGLSVCTNYDPASMYLGLWHQSPGGTPSLLWSQNLGGMRVWCGQTAFDTTVDGGPWYLKVQVAPEPSALTCLAALIACAVSLRRRGR